MPKAELPTHIKGWLVAIAASVVGLIASFFFLALVEKAIS